MKELIDRGQILARDIFFKICPSTNYEMIEEFRRMSGIDREDMWPHLFNEEETFEDNYIHYQPSNEIISKYELMAKACKFCDSTTVIDMLHKSIPITYENLRTLCDVESDFGGNFSRTLKVYKVCPKEIKENLGISLEKLMIGILKVRMIEDSHCRLKILYSQMI